VCPRDSGSALGTTLRTHVHDPVLRLDHGHLVFDDHDRIAVSTTPLMTLSSLRMPSKRGLAQAMGPELASEPALVDRWIVADALRSVSSDERSHKRSCGPTIRSFPTVAALATGGSPVLGLPETWQGTRHPDPAPSHG
jgi:hypothetical protein